MGNVVLDELELRGLLKAVAFTKTMGAANIGAGTDTRSKITLRPATGDHGMDAIVVLRIAVQDVRPSSLTIIAKDLNRESFTIPLPPALYVDDIPLVGTESEGVELELRNASASAVPVIIHAAVMSRQNMERVLGAIPAAPLPWHSLQGRAS